MLKNKGCVRYVVIGEAFSLLHRYIFFRSKLEREKKEGFQGFTVLKNNLLQLTRQFLNRSDNFPFGI